MKNKTLIKLTLVTLIAPSFLNAQGAIAAETLQEKMPVTENAGTITSKEAAPEVEVVPTPEVTPLPVEEAPSTVETVPAPLPKEELAPEVLVTPTPEVVVTPADEPTTPTPTPGDDVSHLPGENNGGLNAPTLSVNPVKMIKKGVVFDPLVGVYAYDHSGDVSQRIKVVTNTVDIAKAIEKNAPPYIVVYEVDSVDGGPKTTRTVEVYVVDDSQYGMLTASISDFTIAQNGDLTAEIKKRLVVKGPDGKVLPASDYKIATNGSAGGGDVGEFNISVVVSSEDYGTSTEVTVKVTVLKGVTLTASDRRILLGETFDPQEGIVAFETMADGTTKNLEAYDVTTDSGLSIIGNVNTTLAGVYPVTYSAKSSSGVVESVTVNITVAESNITINTESSITIFQGSTFTPENYATATDERDGALQVTATHNVATETPGTYSVTYTATNSALKTETVTVPVIVEERIPKIIVSSPTIVQDQEVTDAMIRSWVTVEDPLEADLIDKVTYTVTKRGVLDTTTVGNTFTVDYSVTNSSGNVATASLTVTVAERHATITAADQTVKIGETITDAMIRGWASASDPVDGENLAVTDFKLLDGEINTNVAGSKYRIEYSYTNTAHNTATKVITLSVADVIMPTLNVEDHVMYVGDKLTEEMILAWATTENAENVGFEVLGDAIKVSTPGSTLVEPGTQQIRFTAYAGVNNGKEVKGSPTQPASAKNKEKTITLTVKAKGDGSGNNGHSTIKTSGINTAPKTNVIKTGKATLPKTGVNASNMMCSLIGLILVVMYVFKKKQDEWDIEL
ncbi:DUF5011 domain-containing protein [Vagococcus sp. BWB3-3]|uniref:DUF5011 domain-containing protein n=1 Tax=Vagococcus allomyrinae TaxID=2794353 RepID=A0A940PDL6_9ENTE|nr:immunoglobulin-like domain-containing protein [Vagococcus allomyrinae]MBP1040868.1 DUF5011 domain-containing protein [Vagococcus allomyrinae]